ncbi:MAG: ABC transporter ATP-binding protein [Clostridia bacterium]|nr:ABC transporter ATP-binding protein [Clostridia bacterium]
MIKKFASCIGKYKIFAFLTPLLVICEVVLEVRIPYLMSQIIDIGVANKDVGFITKYGLLMVLLAVLSLITGALGAFTASKAATGFAKGVRQKLFHKIQDFSFANVDKFSTSSLITRLTTDVTNVQHSFMMIIRMMARSPFMLISAVFMAITINKKLTTVFLVALPILGFFLAVIAIMSYPRFGKMLKKFDKLNSIIQENLIGVRVVKAFVREDHESEKFRKAAEDVRKAQIHAEKVIIWNMPIMQFIMYGCMIAIFWFGGNMIIVGQMKTGQLISFISYVSQILMSLMMISMFFINLVISRASIQRITEVFDEVPDISDENATETEVPSGSISFNNVHFEYIKGKEVLKDISFRIESGETVGILGGTGSSKTSLVQLIPRLYDATKGEVSVGGKNVKEYKINALRQSVAMVLQNNVLFSGTIMENLRWGNPDADEEQIISACKDAQAHDFITSFPDGYGTMLGQGGVNLSGGQKQRLCIARALLKKPKIIILDDSTSAVDTATDKKIRTALNKSLKDTTTIIIAQRISSVIDADKIIVMDNGKVDQIGTHEELLLSNEIYKEVYESQQKGADENGKA